MLFNRVLRTFKKHINIYFGYYFVLILCLILGIIIGPIVFKILSLEAKLVVLKFFSPFYKIMILGDSVKSSIMNISIINNVCIIFLIYLLSYVNISIYIIPLVVLLKGLSVGFTVGFLVNDFGLKGFLLAIGGIYIHNIFILTGLIGLGAVSMIKFRKIRYRSNILDEHFTLGVLYSLIIIFGSIVEGLISHKFLSMTLDFFV